MDGRARSESGSRGDNDEDLSRMAILLDSPQGARASLSNQSHRPSPMTQAATSSAPSSEGGTASSLPARAAQSLSSVVERQPVSADYAHFRSSSDSCTGSSAPRRKDTDWFWHWHTSPPKSIGQSTSSGSTAADGASADAGASRLRSNSSPTAAQRKLSPGKRQSLGPPITSPIPGQPVRLFPDVPSHQITQKHRPQPASARTESDGSLSDTSDQSKVYPPLHPTSIPISTPVVVSSPSNIQQAASSPSPRLGHEPMLEEAQTGDLRVPASLFADFTRARHCFSLMPDNSKMVIFDSHLLVKKAFFALVQNGVRSAPVWDSASQTFTGMLTITDFINILRHYYRSPLVQMDELEEHRIQTWRDLAIRRCHEVLVSIDPLQSLYAAVQMLIEKKIHRLPVIDHHTRNCLFILTPKRLLQYIYLEFETTPDPAFMQQSVQSLSIGTYNNIATVSQDTALIVVLNIFAERRISAVPVVDHNGQVVEVYAKFDVINLAAEKTYNNLDVSVKDALKHRAESSKGVHTCLPTECLRTVLRRIVQKQVHRLVMVDTHNHVAGIVSLSDILSYLILKAPRMFR